MERIRLRVEGRVQGVGYRYSACAEARRLGLGGWVRNCDDGGVELEAEGAVTDLDALLGWCERGPTFARVDRVEVLSRESCEVSRDGFTVRS